MQSIFKKKIVDKLLFVIHRVGLAMTRMANVENCDSLLHYPEGVDLFDASCMRIQNIGETLKQIDAETEGALLSNYPEIPWRKVFAMRNIISHEYLLVDPSIITDIIKTNFPLLLEVLQHIADDVNAGKHDALLQQNS